MALLGAKIIPLEGINTDLAYQYMKPTQARFIKNLYYELTDNANAGTTTGSKKGVLKPTQGNYVYSPITLPDGDNHLIGTVRCIETTRVYCLVHNSNGNHCIYRINGKKGTCEMVEVNPLLNFQLNPKFFVGQFQGWVEVIYITNPDTGKKVKKEDLYYTDAFNYINYIRVDDCIATTGFTVPNTYFAGNYDRSIYLRMGLPTPNGCIAVNEIPRTDADAGLINNLLFNTWQFRISVTDVFGRPSEHSIISDLYIPGINDCIGSNQSLPRCLNLVFDAGNPLWNTITIEYNKNNSTQWYSTKTIYLYNGSVLGNWWTRQRNTSDSSFIYNPVNNTITYTFCADGEQNAIPPAETNRLENPIPKTSETLNKIANRVGVANNTEGFNPFPQSLLKNISFEVIPPDKIPIESRTITLYIPIFSIGAHITTGINNLQDGNYFSGVVKDSTGFIWGSGSNGKGADVRGYFQYFPDENRSGFVGYLLGSQSVSISTQVYIDGSGNIIDDPQHNGVNLGFLCFQKFVFTDLRAGTYIFRLASHLANPNTLGGQTLPSGTFLSLFDTSTTVWGVCPFNKGAGYKIDVNNRNSSQELIINVCDADYDSFDYNSLLVIADVSFSDGAASGYGYETKINGDSQYPMELMEILPNTQNTTTSKNTDHNGFYWAVLKFQALRPDQFSFNFYFYNNCIKKSVTSVSGGSFSMGFFNFYMDEIGNFIINFGAPLYPQFLSTQCNRIEVTGRLVLSSNNGIGIPNVLVVLSRGQTGLTDDNGNYKIIAHDDVANGVRNDVIVFSGSVCNYKNTEGGCIPTEPVQILPCVFGACTLRVVIVDTFFVVYNKIVSLLSGGTYGIGVIGWDWLGRGTYIQDLGKITIPTIVQAQAIGASQVRITINPNATFPAEIKYITFFYTNELTIETYIDWIVDRFDLINNKGEINPNAPTQIRIYYASLNQYNAENNFNTTTNWQFLEPLPTGQTTGTQQPFTSDVVQFLYNGSKGFYFGAAPEPAGFIPKQITGLVKYDQTGQYFLINYTSDLAGLQNNALIRLSRPRNVVNEFELYYELCNKIDIVNQKAQVNQFILNAFDTYYLDRQIPIPAPVTPTPTIESITTTVGQIATTVIPIVEPIALNLQVFPFPFESNSPSNFWGKGVKNIGRVNTINPYEAELIRINQIALSGVLSPTGQLSYLQYFDDALKKDFIVQNSGGIMAILYIQGLLYCICQYNNFSVGYNDNLGRVNTDGTFQAPSEESQFGQPQRKIGSDFGCTEYDKSTIREKNGLIMFLDRTRCAVVHSNYESAYAVSEFNESDSSIVSWLIKKIKSIETWNESNPTQLRYFHGMINPINYEYLLSDFMIGSNSYVNEERDYAPDMQETMAFDLLAKVWKGQYGFTPQMAAALEGEVKGQNQLFTFKDGLPYAHYTTNLKAQTFNIFYGIKVERVWQLVVGAENFDKKKFKHMAVYCPQCVYWSDKIETETGQVSLIPKSFFTKAERFFSAAFLCNINSFQGNMTDNQKKNILIEGDVLLGTFIVIRLIGDKDFDTSYTELLGVTVEYFKSESSGLPDITHPKQ